MCKPFEVVVTNTWDPVPGLPSNAHLVVLAWAADTSWAQYVSAFKLTLYQGGQQASAGNWSVVSGWSSELVPALFPAPLANQTTGSAYPGTMLMASSTEWGKTNYILTTAVLVSPQMWYRLEVATQHLDGKQSELGLKDQRL